MGADVLDVERAADHRLERVIGGMALLQIVGGDKLIIPFC